MKHKMKISPQTPPVTQDYPRPADTSDIPKDIRDNLHISPENRICPAFDYLSIASYRVASPDTMGVRVVDNIVHEHIM